MRSTMARDPGHTIRLPSPGRLVLLGALVAGVAVTVFPLLFMVSTALTERVYVLEVPPRLVPPRPTLDNFVQAWNANHFGRAFLNSAVVTGASVGCILLLGSMMAHALARYRFPGRRLVLAAIVFLMIMPAMSLLVPQFVLASRLGVSDSLVGLVVVNVAQGLPLATFILYGFLRDLPRELYEAATVDGAGPLALYRRISVPLGRSALATAGILASLGAWDEYVWAATTINTPELRTLPVAIAAFQGVHQSDWGLILAASLIAVTPVIVLFVLLQRHVVRGLTAGALKG